MSIFSSVFVVVECASGRLMAASRTVETPRTANEFRGLLKTLSEGVLLCTLAVKDGEPMTSVNFAVRGLGKSMGDFMIDLADLIPAETVHQRKEWCIAEIDAEKLKGVVHVTRK